jgi:hypothetical protein
MIIEADLLVKLGGLVAAGVVIWYALIIGAHSIITYWSNRK